MQFLKEGKDWERKATNIPSIFLLRLLRVRSTFVPKEIKKMNEGKVGAQGCIYR